MAQDDVPTSAPACAEQPSGRALTRRHALTRVGPATGAAYAAPTLLSLSEAAADGPGSAPWDRPFHPTKPTKPGKKD